MRAINDNRTAASWSSNMTLSKIINASRLNRARMAEIDFDRTVAGSSSKGKSELRKQKNRLSALKSRQSRLDETEELAMRVVCYASTLRTSTFSNKFYLFRSISKEN